MNGPAGKTTGAKSETLPRAGAGRLLRGVLPARVGPALLIVVVAGAALRLWQYAANTSMWLDEIALADGILSLDLPHLLTGPLPHNQVAPRGFLLAQKLAVTVLGPSDYALRLFPLVCSLVSLAAFARLAVRMLGGAGPLAALLLFAAAPPFIASAALVKPYSADVCVAVLLWWVAYGLASETVTPFRAWRAALLGALLVWFSHSGVLMAAALGASLAAWPMGAADAAGRRRALAPVLVCWGASSLAVTLVALALMSPETREYMHWYWSAGFAPGSAAQFLYTLWPWDRISDLFGPGVTHAGLGYPLPAMYAAATVAGAAVLWREKRGALLLLTAPLALTLGAAVARQYPFSDRMILFLVPGFMLAIGAAAEGVRRLLRPLSRTLGAAAVVVLLLPALYPLAATPPVYRTEHMKPVLAYVQSRRLPGDGIYVYYGAAPVVTFYAKQYGLGRDEYAVGGCHRGDARRYLRELDTFRGRARVWILLTHANPRYREREDILAYLDAIGSRRDSFVVESHGVGRNLLPAEAYLYDLSIDRGAEGVSAESFRLKDAPPAGLQTCRVGPQAMVPADFR